MRADLQREAQDRVGRIAAFRSELAELEREEVLALTPEQRFRLDSHLDNLLQSLSKQYGADSTESIRQVSWAMRLAALLFLAAILAALILFLHRIWGLLPWTAQVVIPLGAPAVFLLGTEKLARREAAPYYVSLMGVLTLTGFIFGLNALGAIWNIAPSPHALLSWALVALCLAYAYRNRLLLAAGILLGCAYAAALWVAWTGGYWLNFAEHPMGLVVAGALIYALPSLKPHPANGDYDSVYRACGAGSALMALLVLGMESSEGGIALAYQLSGLILSAGIAFHGARLGRSLLANLGGIGFVVFLYTRLHAWLWDTLPKYLFFLLLALVALGLVLLFRSLRRQVAARRPL